MLKDTEISRIELIFLLSPTMKLRIELLKTFFNSFSDKKRCEINPNQIFSILEFICQLNLTEKVKCDLICNESLNNNSLIQIWEKFIKNKIKNEPNNLVNNKNNFFIDWKDERIELCLENVNLFYIFYLFFFIIIKIKTFCSVLLFLNIFDWKIEFISKLLYKLSLIYIDQIVVEIRLKIYSTFDLVSFINILI